MIKIVSKTTSGAYKHVFKRILFLFSADTVHEYITLAGRATQQLPFATDLLRFLWRFDHPLLQQTVVGIHFPNPIGLSAGFDKEVRLLKLLRAIGFGYAEVGSITAHPYTGNDRPWYSRLPHTKSILVNSGLRSSGVDSIASRADSLPRSWTDSFPVNASVAKTNHKKTCTIEEDIEDYCRTLRRLEMSEWPTMYTINISCPNTAGGEPFNRPKNLSLLLKAIDELHLSRPVFLKLPIDLPWAAVEPLIKVASQSKIQGLTLGNLAKSRISVDKRDNLSPQQPGNLSGKPCWDASNELLARTYTTYGNRFTLIGVGGVFSAEDAYTKIKLGASLVELITGMIYLGPALIGQINQQLAYFLERDGYTTVSAAVGVDAPGAVQNLAISRHSASSIKATLTQQDARRA